MSKAGGVTQGFDFGGGDVNEIGGGEHHSVIGHFVVVEGGFFVRSEPSIENELGEGAMVAVVVDGPVGEDDVGVLGGEELGERLVVAVVDDGLAVDLIGEDGAGVEDLADLLGFGGADGGAIGISGFAKTFAAV